VVAEVIAIAMSKPPLFEPGTNWAFSDTNFLLLGQVLRKVGRKPIEVLERKQMFKLRPDAHRGAGSPSTAWPPSLRREMNSTSGWWSARNASMSRRLKTSAASFESLTFSCDIARPVSRELACLAHPSGRRQSQLAQCESELPVRDGARISSNSVVRADPIRGLALIARQQRT
jgi:hypothetical protein